MNQCRPNQSWKNLLSEEKQQPYFRQILQKISEQRRQGKIIYPGDDHIFEAFRLTPLNELKVVLLGQDPYHGPSQAHGLCFSVLPGTKPPPSLQNIFKELHNDMGCAMPVNGSLVNWAKQGVLLLNTLLTVEQNKPQSHLNLGWERFTDRVISLISQHCPHIVFILWGANAQRKSSLIDGDRHTLLKAPHPSPLSAYRGFFECKHFSRCNRALIKHHQQVIDWCL